MHAFVMPPNTLQCTYKKNIDAGVLSILETS